MSKRVFDTSALLAIINVESGWERVLELLSDDEVLPLVSAVNLSEIQAVLINRGISDEKAWKLIAELNLSAVPFDAEQARSAGGLIAQTRKFGLSFGDRACIALGIQERCIVVTADRAWAKLKIGVTVELVRH